MFTGGGMIPSDSKLAHGYTFRPLSKRFRALQPRPSRGIQRLIHWEPPTTELAVSLSVGRALTTPTKRAAGPPSDASDCETKHVTPTPTTPCFSSVGTRPTGPNTSRIGVPAEWHRQQSTRGLTGPRSEIPTPTTVLECKPATTQISTLVCGKPRRLPRGGCHSSTGCLPHSSETRSRAADLAVSSPGSSRTSMMRFVPICGSSAPNPRVGGTGVPKRHASAPTGEIRIG